jgi:hypothetical protein
MFNLEQLLCNGIGELPSLGRESAPRSFFFDELLRAQTHQSFTMAIEPGV